MPYYYYYYSEEPTDITYIGSPYNEGLDNKNYVLIKEFKLFKGIFVI